MHPGHGPDGIAGQVLVADDADPLGLQRGGLQSPGQGFRQGRRDAGADPARSRIVGGHPVEKPEQAACRGHGLAWIADGHDDAGLRQDAEQGVQVADVGRRLEDPAPGGPPCLEDLQLGRIPAVCGNHEIRPLLAHPRRVSRQAALDREEVPAEGALEEPGALLGSFGIQGMDRVDPRQEPSA